MDDDEIMLQIAIQQSLAAEQANKNGNERVECSGDDPNSSAELPFNIDMTSSILPVRDSRGSTQSLQEFQERQSHMVYGQREDLLLQR